MEGRTMKGPGEQWLYLDEATEEAHDRDRWKTIEEQTRNKKHPKVPNFDYTNEYKHNIGILPFLHLFTPFIPKRILIVFQAVM